VASWGWLAVNIASLGGITTIGVGFKRHANGVPRRTCGKYGLFWSRDAGRQFCNVVSDEIPRLFMPNMGHCLFVVTTGVATLGVRFTTSHSKAYRGWPVINMASICSVVTTGDTTLRVGFRISRSKASRDWPMRNITSFGGVATISVATLGVGFQSSFAMASGVSPGENVASFGGVATLASVFQLRIKCYPENHLR
jgi:hypothetical protein